MMPAFRAYARWLSGSQDTADDIVQEALLRAWAARETYRKGSHFKAWMFTILRNTFLSLARRRKFEGEYREGAEAWLAAPANQLDHLSVLELRSALGKLPEQQHHTLMLVVADGCSYAEAAEICGCEIGTVKSRVGRARSALQAMLDGDA
jgi:RNA polymerase sigma-70 factor (ECF subfamily)